MVGISSIPGQSQSIGVLLMFGYQISGAKVGSKANKYVFLGFAKDSGACRFLDLDTNSIIKAQDAEFF